MVRRALTLVLLALLFAGAWWLARPEPRSANEPLPGPVAEGNRLSEAELVEPARGAAESAPEPGADARAAPAARDAGRRTKLAPGRPPEPAPRSAVRGRLVVAETGDAIEEALAVHLRTIDLVREESLVTRLDGTFTSAGEFERGVLLARVQDENGHELMDHEALFDPQATEEWRVPVPARAYPTLARGRVVDRRGNPLAEVRVQLVPLDASQPYAEKLSDEEGSFTLVGLRAGTFRLHLQGVWARSEPALVSLRAGTNELGERVLAEPDGPGLVVRFAPAQRGRWPDAVLALRSKASPYEVLYGTGMAEELASGVFELRLGRIPAGGCTLTIHSRDGCLYEPRQHTFTPPAEVEVAVRGGGGEGVVLRVRDAQSGELLTRFEVWNRQLGLWQRNGVSVHRHPGEEAPVSQLEVGDMDAWVVLAPGHRGAFGTNELARDGVVEVALERGWSELLVFEDVEGDALGNPDFGRRRALLAGVEVRADGEFVGASDEDGLVLLTGAGQPAALEFRLGGWWLVSERHLGALRFVGLVRPR